MGKFARSISADGLSTLCWPSEGDDAAAFTNGTGSNHHRNNPNNISHTMTGAASEASAAVAAELEAQIRKLRFLVSRAQDAHDKQEMSLLKQLANVQQMEESVRRLREQHVRVNEDWQDAQDEVQQSRQLRNEMIQQQRSLGEDMALMKREVNDLECKRVQMQLDMRGKQQFNRELEVLLERVKVQREEEDRNNEEKRRQLQHMREQEKALKHELEQLRSEKQRQP